MKNVCNSQENGVRTRCAAIVIRADSWEGDEDSNFSVSRVRRFTESPGPLHWIAFPVEILTKPLIHWIASSLFTENPFFFHWKKCFVASPSPNNRLKSKSQCDSKFITRSKFTTQSIFSETKFSPKRKFLAGHPCGHPAKNFGQGPPNPAKTSILERTSRVDVHEKTSVWKPSGWFPFPINFSTAGSFGSVLPSRCCLPRKSECAVHHAGAGSGIRLDWGHRCVQVSRANACRMKNAMKLSEVTGSGPIPKNQI